MCLYSCNFERIWGDFNILVIFPAFYSIMDLPLGNFFEVTVNSTKLFTFFDEIQRKVQTQDCRI